MPTPACHRPPYAPAVRLLATSSARSGFDAALAAAVALLGVVELATGQLLQDGAPLQYVVAVLMGAALLPRRRWPMGTLVAVCALFAGQAMVLGQAPEVLTEAVAMLIAPYSVAAFADLRLAVPGLALAMCGGLVRELADHYDAFTAVVNSLWVLPAWAIGLVVHRHERRAEQAVRRAQVATQEERLRIAREMHDVVAHGIGVMVLHARGGRRVLDSDSEAARTAFDTVIASGEEALGEMRRLLGLLRDPDGEADRAPAPGLAALPGLLESFRSGGLPVEADLIAARDLAPGVELVLFRVVQEALTNCARHGGRAASVRFSRQGTVVHLEVEDRGGGPDEGMGSGRGLVGIRERVSLLGGAVETGPVDGGGYRVHVAIPLAEAVLS